MVIRELAFSPETSEQVHMAGMREVSAHSQERTHHWIQHQMQNFALIAKLIQQMLANVMPSFRGIEHRINVFFLCHSD